MNYLAGCRASQHFHPTLFIVLIAPVFAATAINSIYLKLILQNNVKQITAVFPGDLQLVENLLPSITSAGI
jgi:hypothetical protein